MYALAGSLGFPPIFDATTERQRKRRRLIVGLILSAILHLVLLTLLWFHRAELQPSPFVDDSPVAVLPFFSPPAPAPTPDAPAGGGGGAEAAAARPSPPVHAPPVTTPPPVVAPFAPAPESPALMPTPAPAVAGEADNAGRGHGPAGGGTGAGIGDGSGSGRGSGAGLGTGGGAGGWNPQWIRMPTHYEARWFYPGKAGSQVNGWAVIRCDITSTGRARRCRMLAESGPGFGPAAVNASRYFRITPREVDGRAVEAPLDIRLEFYTD